MQSPVPTGDRVNERYYEYDVGLSFAGEQREYVEQVANELRSRGIRVFFDDYERDTLWGKDLYAHLSNVYEHMCRFCVIFVSKDYAAKVWPNRERESAQARALREKQEYILPARFDDTPIPGLLPTVGYVNLNHTSPVQLSEQISKKVGKQARRNYLPPILDRLFQRLGIEDDPQAQARVTSHAWAFFEVLRRMTAQERSAVVNAIRFGCPMELPDVAHINADFLRRLTSESIPTLKRVLGNIRSLGFECSLVDRTTEDEHLPGVSLGETHVFYVKWVNLSNLDTEWAPLLVAHEMIVCATEDYCEDHGTEFLERLDFSQLADATASSESAKER